MEINVIENDKNYVLKLVGAIDYNNAEEFESKVKEIIVEAKSIIFDMEMLEYISSAGLRVIVWTLSEMDEKGDVQIINVNSVVKEILELVGMDNLIKKG